MFIYVYLLCHHFRRPTEPPKNKPNVIQQYNRYMLGVDKLDQMMCYYSFIHKSTKWWRKVFFWILELTVVNSYIIYQHTRNEIKQNSVHLAFRLELIHHLIEPLLTSRLQPLIPQPISKERLKHQNAHYMEMIRRKRKDCVEVKMECVILPYIVQRVPTIHHFV